MRIRKNANLSSLLMFSHASGAKPLQSHVCQLNQSPWDVIPFSQETHPSSSSLQHQFEDEDSFNGNGSLGDSVGAVESNSFADREEEKKVDKMLIDDNSEIEEDEDEDEEDEMKIECPNKSDSKVSQFRNEKKRVHSMCENHLTSMKSCSDKLTRTKKNLAPATGGRRGRGRPARKGTTSNSGSNPYEFYYYSGFGPLWGKRRGGGRGRGAGGGGEIITKIAEIDEINDNTTSSSVDHFENLDFLDDDDDDDSENGESVKKKRMRKPVKARSLKSLM